MRESNREIRAEGKPGAVRLCIEWGSGRVESLPLRRFFSADRFELRAYVRELSASSPQIKRVWAEDTEGGLLYLAANGKGRAPRHAVSACLVPVNQTAVNSSAQPAAEKSTDPRTIHRHSVNGGSLRQIDDSAAGNVKNCLIEPPHGLLARRKDK